MKKILLAIFIVLSTMISVTAVFAQNLSSESSIEKYSQARINEIQYKQNILKQMQMSKNITEESTYPEEDPEISRALEEAQQRAAIRIDYCKRTVTLVNKTLGLNYQVITEFDYNLMRAVVDAYYTKSLTNTEKELLKGYMGEYCCGVDGNDPLYHEIMQILSYPFGEESP